MIHDLKPYPAYKDSGVPLLGEVPEHWEVRRVKQICRFAYGDSLPRESRQHGDVPVLGSNGRVGFHTSANTRSPCIVIGRKGSFGKVNFASEPVFAIDTTFFVDERFTRADLRWLSYLLGWLKLDEVSKDSAVPGLDRGDAYQQLAASPTDIAEQSAIARFLDSVDRRIGRYIRAKRRLIELLNEQKQAIINRAVTRGLDPNVRLKPSGIDWLGGIPEHWEVRRLKFICREPLKYGANQASGRQEEGEPRFVRITDIDEEGNLRDNTLCTISNEEAEGFLLSEGDILLARSGATVGKSFLYRTDWGTAAFAGYLIRAKINPRLALAQWVYMFTRSGTYSRWKDSVFIQATIQNISAEKYSSIFVPVPPLAEQARIVEWTSAEVSKIDSLITRAKRQVRLIGEFRMRLIADAVTGKVDVRHLAPEGVEPLAEDLEPLEEGEDIPEDELQAAEDADASEETDNADE